MHKLEFNIDEINILLSGLCELKAGVSFELIQKIRTIVEKDLEESKAEKEKKD